MGTHPQGQRLELGRSRRQRRALLRPLPGWLGPVFERKRHLPGGSEGINRASGERRADRTGRRRRRIDSIRVKRRVSHFLLTLGEVRILTLPKSQKPALRNEASWPQ